MEQLENKLNSLNDSQEKKESLDIFSTAENIYDYYKEKLKDDPENKDLKKMLENMKSDYDDLKNKMLLAIESENTITASEINNLKNELEDVEDNESYYELSKRKIDEVKSYPLELKIDQVDIENFKNSASIGIKTYDDFFKEYILKDNALDIGNYKHLLGYIKDKDILIKSLEKTKNTNISLKQNINKVFYNDIDIIEKVGKINNGLRTLDLKILDNNYIKNLNDGDLKKLINATHIDDIGHILVNFDKNKFNNLNFNDDIKNIITNFYENKFDENKIAPILNKISEKKLSELKDDEFIILDQYVGKNKDIIKEITDFILDNEENLNYFSKLPKVLNYILKDNNEIKNILTKNIKFIMYLDKDQRKREDIIDIILEKTNKDDIKYLDYIELDTDNINLIFKIYKTLKNKIGEEGAKYLFINEKARLKLLNFMEEIKDKELYISQEYKNEFDEIKNIFDTFAKNIEEKRKNLQEQIIQNKELIANNKENLDQVISKLLDSNNIENKEQVKKLIKNILENPDNLEKDFSLLIKLLSKEGVPNKEIVGKIKNLLELIISELKKSKEQTQKEISSYELSEDKKDKYKRFLDKNGKIASESIIKEYKEKYLLEQKKKNKGFDENLFKNDFLLQFDGLDEKLLEEIKKLISTDTAIKTTTIIQKKLSKNTEEAEKIIEAFKTGDQGKIDNFWNEIEKDYHKEIEAEVKQTKEQENKKAPVENKTATTKIENTKIENNDYSYNLGATEVIVNLGQKKETISLSDDEKTIIKNNPESLKNIVDFYKVLDKVGLSQLWDFKEQIFKTIGEVNGIGFNIDSNYLDENETKIFLNSILKSIGFEEINPIFTLDNFLSNFEVINNTQIGGNEANNMNYGRNFVTKIESLFLNKFFEPGSILGFKLGDFKESLR